jgi:hypothetical protein
MRRGCLSWLLLTGSAAGVWLAPHPMPWWQVLLFVAAIIAGAQEYFQAEAEFQAHLRELEAERIRESQEWLAENAEKTRQAMEAEKERQRKAAEERAAAAAEAEKNKPWWEKAIDGINDALEKVDNVVTSLVYQPLLPALEMAKTITLWETPELWTPSVWGHIISVEQTFKASTDTERSLGYNISNDTLYTKIGPLKVTGAPNGNTTYEITFPSLLPSANPKIGLEVGTFKGSPGTKLYSAVSGVVKTPDGDVEFKTTLGDTAIWRPQNLLLAAGIVMGVSLVVGIALLSPSLASKILEWLSNLACPPGACPQGIF